MDEQWNERLECPICRRVGHAGLVIPSNEEIPTVTTLAEGFKVVQATHGPNFKCERCGVPVRP
jgi:hypothetical protein